MKKEKKRKRKPPVRSDEERNALVTANLGLAFWVARRFLRRHPEARRALGGMEEAESAALEGLLRAAELWEPSRAQFTTYAVKWCWQACQMRWRNSDLVRGKRAHGKRVSWEYAEVQAEEHDPDTLQRSEEWTQVQEALRVLPTRWRKVLLARAEGRTMREIGAELGVSSSFVGQLEKKALAHVQRRLKEKGVLA